MTGDNPTITAGVSIVFAIYLRVSTDKQETDAQKQDIYDWCQRQGYAGDKLIEYVDQGISGKKTANRPALQSLLNDVKSGKITKIITFESSRLSRDFMDFLNIMSTLSENGVTLEIPNKGIQSFNNSTDKLLMSVQAFVANQFLEDHSRRITAGMKAAKKREPSLSYGAPKGNTHRRGKTKDHDPKLVEKITDLRSEGLSTRKIAKTLELTQSMVSRLCKRYCA